MTDLHAGMILAAIQLIVMFGAMRAFYGAWPWEYRKTWYATKPRPAPPPSDGSFNGIGTQTVKWMAREPLEQLVIDPPTLTVEIPKPFGIVAGTDTFERPDPETIIPREQIQDAARNP